jgi:Sulfatase-modifying factor enzyme 1
MRTTKSCGPDGVKVLQQRPCLLPPSVDGRFAWRKRPGNTMSGSLTWFIGSRAGQLQYSIVVAGHLSVVAGHLSKILITELVDLKLPSVSLVRSGLVPMSLAEADSSAGCQRQADMRLVSGNTFCMGSDEHYPEQAPVHRVTVDTFWMDRPPVTNSSLANSSSGPGTTHNPLAPK